MPWYLDWFNEDYLKLYARRNRQEACGQVDFLIKAMDLSGGEKILDLGCGSGRHTLELAKRGFEVTGVDISQTLIQEGRKGLLQSPELNANFFVEDIFALKGFPLYDVIISLFTSFGYFEKDQDNEEFFQVVSSHLKEHGKLFLDFLHPFQVQNDLVPFEEIKVEGEKVKIYKSIENSRVVKRIVFSNPERSYQEKVKLYSRDQIEAMMRLHGLKVSNVWNDYEGNPWREEGDRQIFYCIRIPQ